MSSITYGYANNFKSTRQSRNELMFKLSDREKHLFLSFVNSVNGGW